MSGDLKPRDRTLVVGAPLCPVRGTGLCLGVSDSTLRTPRDPVAIIADPVGKVYPIVVFNRLEQLRVVLVYGSDSLSDNRCPFGCHAAERLTAGA